MTKLILRWLLNAAALWAAAYLVPGIDHEGWVALLLIALVFGLINALIRPLLKVLTCPLQILTLGLFTLVINALLLLLTSWIAQNWLLRGQLAEQFSYIFKVDNFWPAAVLGALVVSVVSIVGSIFLKDRGEKKRRRDRS
ncbi:MAG TPA: phage holin family protein [Anaerolineae bacterium]|nr:phage holin family protein [Anaerolineae bacterium]